MGDGERDEAVIKEMQLHVDMEWPGHTQMRSGIELIRRLQADLSALRAERDRLREACEAYDAAWTKTCPAGPNVGAPSLSASTIAIWRLVRAGLDKPQKG